MKLKNVLTLAIGFAIPTVNAQVKKKATTTKKVTTNISVAKVETKLSSLKDSLSYALGVDIAKSLKQGGFDINSNLLGEALRANLDGKPTLIEEDKTASIISSAIVEIRSKPSREFLAENKKRPNVKVTPEGLQYEVLVEGQGAQPTVNDEVTVHYSGTLVNGEKFDSSYDRNEPLTLNLNQVIEGWKIGIPLMKVGSKYKFYIPYNLGYGERATSAIPAFSTLIFEVELLDVKKSSES